MRVTFGNVYITYLVKTLIYHFKHVYTSFVKNKLLGDIEKVWCLANFE